MAGFMAMSFISFATGKLEGGSLFFVYLCGVCMCVCVCVCVCVCGGEWAIHCSLHLCGSPLLFQVATCSFLVQKEHRGPKQKGGTQTLGEANEALGLPNTEDDKWGPSLSGFIIE